MRLSKVLLIFVFFNFFYLVIFSGNISGQHAITDNFRIIPLSTRTDTILYYPETIIPQSITWKWKDSLIDIKYRFLDNNIEPMWDQSNHTGDSVLLAFKVLPFPFHERISIYDSSQIQIAEGDIFYFPAIRDQNLALVASEGLNYDGALTRGISLGNNQSLVFDSELNLQLNGNIGDGYHIRAAITDHNLPIQPDGTTRQLQEFDKVFIEIMKDRHSILAGDFDVISPQGYFMKYNRKLKGAQYGYENSGLKIKGTAAVSRGNFTRQTLIPAEGNQGPYPLRGENGESFIIILGGSERVYLDGRLLIRGEDADYIMDYNQSEIIFTKNILINSRHRIVVEFEYAQFNFQRSNTALEINYQKNSWQTFFNFFQETDSKTITGDLALTPEDLLLLQNAGDPDGVFYKSGVRQANDGYNTNSIFYAKKDTIVNGILYEDILIWSTSAVDDHFIVSFSEVGSGNGDYIISENPSPNGRVYEWISPDPLTGHQRGNFLPLLPLLAPQQKQMLSSGFNYKSKKGVVIYSELSLSRNDLNRYSTLEDDDNQGAALKLNFSTPIKIGGPWTLTPFGSYEGKTDFFQQIDPYRNPEFTRDWNLDPGHLRQKEHLPVLGVRIGQSNKLFTQYQYEGLFTGFNYNGNRHSAQIHIDTTGWRITGLFSQLSAADKTQHTSFIRPTVTAERLVFKQGEWWLGGSYYEDKQEVTLKPSGLLSPLSFVQNRWSLFFHNPAEAPLHFHAGYHQESPKSVHQNQLIPSEKATEWNITGHARQLKSFAVDYTVRHRTVLPMHIQNGARAEHLLGRIDMRTDIWKKSLKWTGGYEIGSGQEPRAEYKFIRVQKGEGIYVWIDDGDGIEEYNEFEQTPFPDEGEYLKLSVFNNDYVRTRSLQLQQSLNADLRLLKGTGFISKISLASTYQLSRKVSGDQDHPFWNPFYRSYPDTAVLAFNSTFRNILYWNRSNPRYDIQASHYIQRNQQLLTSGFEIRSLEDIALRMRISLLKKTDLVVNLRHGRRENQSEFFENRNYQLKVWEAGPEMNIIFKEKWRMTGNYVYQSQKNIPGFEKFSSHKLGLESVWRQSNTVDVRGMVSMVHVTYVSMNNPNVDFAILQGLQPGINFLWTIQFNTRLNKNLVLTLQYNGRDTGEARTVHTGSAQVRANF